MTLSQRSPIENKIGFVRARLDRFRNEGKASRNTDELKRQKSLFECVSRVRRLNRDS